MEFKYNSGAAKMFGLYNDAGAARPWEENGKHYVTINGQTFETNASTLRKEEWVALDEAIVKAAESRLVVAQDLMSRGLTYSVDGLSNTVLETERMSNYTGAERSMDFAPTQRDRVEFDLQSLQLPVTAKDFGLSTRVLNASRTRGAGLDTLNAERAARGVAESIETLLISGDASYGISGYTSFADRNTVTLVKAWDTPATGAEILADVLAMKQANIDANYYGPYVLYIPTAYETVLDDDFKAETGITIRERILEISSIEDIKVVDSMPADNVVLVQMTSDVVRMVDGLPMQTIEWTNDGGLNLNFKVATIMVPQIRSDYNGNTGIAHLSA